MQADYRIFLEQVVIVDKPSVLIISSADPFVGPGVLALDMYKAFLQQHFDCDLLTKYEVADHPEILYVEKRPETSFFARVKRKLHYYKEKISPTEKPGPYYFFYKKEENPPVSVEKVLKTVKKKYDVVLLIFWQELLSFKTVLKLYEQQKALFVFRNVDYSTMSGGCHFVGSCERFKIGCGACPVWNSSDENDFTASNVKYRESVYKRVKPVITGNYYMQQYYRQSYLLKDMQYALTFPIIDTDKFTIFDSVDIRLQSSIPTDAFVISFASQSLNDERKGMKYIFEALSLFRNMISEDEANRVFVITAGNSNNIEDKIPFAAKHFGYVPHDFLPKFYNISDVFLCSSVNDAGPMMVNQSICCGTPVVGFEMGACLQIVKDCGTGYCAKLKDAQDLAKGIKEMYNLSNEERAAIKERCRTLGVEKHSYKAQTDFVLELYNKYKNN